jgi:hypothetical protein
MVEPSVTSREKENKSRYFVKCSSLAAAAAASAAAQQLGVKERKKKKKHSNLTETRLFAYTKTNKSSRIHAQAAN